MKLKHKLEKIISNLSDINSALIVIANGIYYTKDFCQEDTSKALNLASNNLSIEIKRIEELWSQIN